MTTKKISKRKYEPVNGQHTGFRGAAEDRRNAPVHAAPANEKHHHAQQTSQAFGTWSIHVGALIVADTHHPSVGVAEGCDLLILLFQD